MLFYFLYVYSLTRLPLFISPLKCLDHVVQAGAVGARGRRSFWLPNPHSWTPLPPLGPSYPLSPFISPPLPPYESSDINFWVIFAQFIVWTCVYAGVCVYVHGSPVCVRPTLAGTHEESIWWSLLSNKNVATVDREVPFWSRTFLYTVEAEVFIYCRRLSFVLIPIEIGYCIFSLESPKL